jgi:3-isopropylmalate/(R)-2-methylmalate dehydratase small subunit
MEPLKTIVSRTVVLPIDNVDTDQIIPARFLKGTTKSGLGEKLFSDWRYDAQGGRKADFVLNRPEAQGAAVLVAGDNFGCGSSREHAPWALVDYGFRAVVSTSIADIFRNNALKNGLLPIVVEPALHARLLAEPGASVTISLEDQTLRFGDGDAATTAQFAVDPFARYCLLNGVDELAFLLSAESDIAAFEAKHAARR